MLWWFLTCCASSSTSPAQRTEGVVGLCQPEEGVRRHDEVAGRRERRDVVGAAGGDADPQARRVARRLARPRRDDAGRRDHEERAVVGALDPRPRDEREHLEGLAEAHVVGQDPAEPVLPQEREPPEPFALVGPQVGRQAHRLRAGDDGEVAQRLRAADPVGRLGVDDARLGELGPQAEVVLADPDPVALALAQLGRRGDHLPQAVELGAVGRDVAPAGEDEELVAEGQCRQYVGERHPLAVDGDGDLEVEPVGRTVGGLAVHELEADLGGLVDLAEVGALDLDHLDAGEPAEVGQVVDRQGERIAAVDGVDAEQVRRHRRPDVGLLGAVAHPSQPVAAVERAAAGVVVAPLPVELGRRRGVPAHRDDQRRLQGGRQLDRAVGGADGQVPDEPGEPVAEGLELAGGHLQRLALDHRADARWHPAPQLGELEVPVGVEQADHGGVVAGEQQLATPERAVDVDTQLEPGGPSHPGEVGGEPDRLVPEGDRPQRRDRVQLHTGGDGGAQQPRQLGAELVERRCGAGGLVAERAVRLPGGMQSSERVGLLGHQRPAEHQVADVGPVGAGADPVLPGSRPQRPQPQHRGILGVAVDPPLVEGELEGDRHRLRSERRRAGQLVDERAEAPLPRRGAVATDVALAHRERHRRAVLAHVAHRAGAEAEDPSRRRRAAPPAGPADLAVQLHVVGRERRAADVGGRGHRPGAQLVQVGRAVEAVDVAAGAGEGLGSEVLLEELVGERGQDVHGATIVARGADSARSHPQRLPRRGLEDWAPWRDGS
ncbi:hypothetical protein [Nocardioides sp. TF02-7]|uniref:hypothetical protein n=1 Tax=Nocardioides sp. TF02-7 TaxID=2917724 RepID=UPI0023D9CB6B|nr:hypothetical protein [Nocardioides sp. TF02-7]